ncbi:hypothetical protein G7046_g2242 [Stylonectria norvegica]|nr:hypothetical protein G7046_g2242 [Stylonectria norvegica]
MTAILDDQVDELLRKAEQRLRKDAPPAGAVATVSASTVAVVKAGEPTGARQPSSKADLSVRPPPLPLSAQPKVKDTAGANWFDLPKTQLTPEFKRDWQLLRMRSILDPKHQKKALRASAPEYSQLGEIIAGPTEFFSARLTRKERKGTLLDEVMSTYNDTKFKNKYAGIQKQKTSGGKKFYKQVVATRRKRR